MNMRAYLLIAIAAAMLQAPPASFGQGAGTRHAVLIGGLGGDPAYTERFGSYLSDMHALLVDRAGFDADHVVVLAEEGLADEPFVDGVSTAEEIRGLFEQLADRITSDDHVYLVLFGHGSYDGTNARLNIPRRDLDDVDYAELLDALPAARSVVVNTASASGPFVEALSGPERIVITATASGTERNETVFPRYFIEALGSADADLDKDGALSVREAFTYAAREVAASFEETGHLATEHAQIDDNGDGQASRADQPGDDGHLASVTYIRPAAALASVSDAARPMLQEKEALERSIAEVKSRKERMEEDTYYAELEELFVRLARINDRMEATP